MLITHQDQLYVF